MPSLGVNGPGRVIVWCIGFQGLVYVGLAVILLLSRAPYVPWVVVALDAVVFGGLAARQPAFAPLLVDPSSFDGFKVAAIVASCIGLIVSAALQAVQLTRIRRSLQRGLRK